MKQDQTELLEINTERKSELPIRSSLNSSLKPNQNYKFKIIKDTLLGTGLYSSVYLGLNESLNNMKVAIKIEKNPSKYLEFESKVIKYLQGGIGIPKFYDYFIKEPYSFLIIEYFSQDLRNFIKTQPSIIIKTLVNISIQMLSRVEFLHSKGIIHRDIKPENFCLGSNQSSQTVYLIDFGLCKKYLQKNKTHIEFSENSGFIGTPKYASINSHSGISLSRRDDLESLAYSIIYLFRKGNLPWEKIHGVSSEERNNIILDMKTNLSEEEICKNLHPNLPKFLKYVKKLAFNATPDYRYLHGLLTGINTTK